LRAANKSRGRAGAEAARARHAQAVATLAATLRSTAQDVENALAALEASGKRETYADEGLAAARALLDGNEAAFRAGRLSLFELEDARRTFNNAINSHIEARRDRAQAWVSLVKATGARLDLHTATT
jgi:outer membrane protein TolC